VFGKSSCSEVEEPLRSCSVMFLFRTKRIASEFGARSFRTLYICLTLDLARPVSRDSHPRVFDDDDFY
jgi:hypothetical protein